MSAVLRPKSHQIDVGDLGSQIRVHALPQVLTCRKPAEMRLAQLRDFMHTVSNRAGQRGPRGVIQVADEHFTEMPSGHCAGSSWPALVHEQDHYQDQDLLVIKACKRRTPLDFWLDEAL